METVTSSRAAVASGPRAGRPVAGRGGRLPDRARRAASPGRGRDVRDPFPAGHDPLGAATRTVLLDLALHGAADLGQAYLTAPDSASRRAVLRTALTGADPAPAGPLARLAEAWSAIGPDRTDVGVFRVLARVAAGGTATRSDVPPLRDGAPKWDWILAAQALSQLHPDRQGHCGRSRWPSPPADRLGPVAHEREPASGR